MKEMTKKIFKDNLLLTVGEFQELENVEFDDYQFVINPVQEKNKSLNSKDDFIRLNILSVKNIGNKVMDIDSVVSVLGGLIPLVPIWINVRLEKVEKRKATFHLECSLRFRKPSLLNNVETGHAPFKMIGTQ